MIFNNKVIFDRNGHIEIRHDLCPAKYDNLHKLIHYLTTHSFRTKILQEEIKFNINGITCPRKQYEEYLNLTIERLNVFGSKEILTDPVDFDLRSVKLVSPKSLQIISRFHG